MAKKSPLFIIACLFFIFGFVTWLNSALIPFFKISCELSHFESYLVTFAFYVAYFVFAIPSSKVLNKVGYAKGMSIGLWIMSIGALAFVPAALMRNYMVFLIGLFVMGTGLTLLQTAANPYVAIIGPIETAAKRISVMGVCNKIAGAIAPIILGSIVLSSDRIKPTEELLLLSESEKIVYLDGLVAQCIPPYICIALTLFLLSVLVRRSSLPDINTATNKEHTRFNILKYPRLIGGIISLFLYVGAEVISIDTLIDYALSNNIDNSIAKTLPSYSMLALIVGYFVGIWGIPKRFSQRQALIGSAFLGVVFSLAILFSPIKISLILLILLGLANALLWPAIWALSIQGLGEHTAKASSFLIMAIIGGALLPLVYGVLADILDLQSAYTILLPAYIIIMLYGIFINKLNFYRKKNVKFC